MRPSATRSDLAAVPRRGAVGRREAAVVGRPESVQHGEARLVSGAETCLCLCHPGPGVLLQEPMRVLAPAGALADELDLRLALARHELLERRGGRDDLGPRHLRERWALVSEDARVAVLVCGDRARDSHVGEQVREDPHRMLGSRVFGIGLDAVEVGLGAHAGDLERRHERGRLPVPALDVRDRTLGREETRSASGTGRSSGRRRRARGAPCPSGARAGARAARWSSSGSMPVATAIGRPYSPPSGAGPGSASRWRRRSSSSTAEGCSPRAARST